MSQHKPFPRKVKSLFLDRLKSDDSPVLLFDGATGTSLQNLNLSLEDFGGEELEGCNENLVFSSPKAVEQVHKEFLEAGADVIETNTFGSTSVVLAEYNLQSKAYLLNKKAAELARKLADRYSTASKPRFVAGSMGPTTKLPTLGHITFDQLYESYKEQANGLYDGDVDLFLIETCQDVLQIKAALLAIEDLFDEKGHRKPIMVSITMETTGTMLVGSDIASALTILQPFNIDVMGLNCATGPEQMKDHIKYLSENSPFHLSCIPNAGLPENIGGKAHYKLSPLELKMQLFYFIKDLGVRIIGGCCGTTPDHIAALNSMIKEIEKDKTKINFKEKKKWLPSAASIYSTCNYDQDNSFLIVGERLNASGSKKTRDLLNSEDWDGLIGLARQQVKENSHLLDINVDYVGRDGVKDMKEIVSRLATNVDMPLMLDSTEWQKMESGLKVFGGKSILNSTNFEDGDERFFKVLDLAKKYGSGIVVGTIDEDGMARTAQGKFAIAERAYRHAINYGIPPYEIFYDPLALPISTGLDEDRRNGLETINSIKMIRENLAGVHVILGISNISFGLSPAARITLNSVFLHDCCAAGLDSAIVSPAKIIPLSKINTDHQQICRDLIYDQRTFNNNICSYDPLNKLTELFQGISINDAKNTTKSLSKLPIEERLKQHIIDGERVDLELSLDIGLKKFRPLDIINNYLLDGMRVVGELFGSGQMQLPFVLQSAQTMKAAVAYLEPYMDSSDDSTRSKAKFLIATVKGDVHDIGKNLVDIILTNNGYEVINLGIKQDVKSIIDAQRKYKADCIAMSGLLVKSTAFMKDNLQAFNEANITVPVILGGAALTPRFVNNDCGSVYKGIVIYGKDAFTDLRFMDSYVKAKSQSQWNDEEGFLNEQPKQIADLINKSSKQISTPDNKQSHTEINMLTTKLVNFSRSSSVNPEKSVAPPFTGSKIVTAAELPINVIQNYLDKNALMAGQWQMKKNNQQTKAEHSRFLQEVAEPILAKWIKKIEEENLLQPAVVYGYFPCGRIKNSLKVFSPTDNSLLGTFVFPRQKGGNRYCISDFYNDLIDNQPTDYLPMQAVTMGSKASEYANNLFRNDEYTDYLYFHGLAVQLAEALAELVHAKIRQECGFSSEEPSTLREILAQRYRGSRYSFGYPACPKVSDSKQQLKWLQASRIGLSIDDSDQLHPEQSTTAIISLHSKSRYFSA